MKKYLYLMALIAMAGVTYTSCSSDDDDSVKVTLKEPATKDIAARYTIETPQNSYIKEVDGVQYALTEFEITEDNGILIRYDELQTRAMEGFSSIWSWHKFTKEGDDRFIVIGFGEFIVEAGEPQPGGYHKRSHISLIPDGVNPIDVYASLMEPNIEGELSGFLCRTWNITRSRILVVDWSVTKDNTRRETALATTWFSETDGTVHLMDLINYANTKHNAGLNTDLGERNTVENLFFSSNGTFTINYANTNLRDVGSWSWVNQDNNEKSGNLTYVWYNEDMGNDLLGGVASIKFNGNKATLRLMGKDRSGTGSGTGHNSEYTGTDFGLILELEPASNK